MNAPAPIATTAVARPRTVSQATTVEQQRATAEVLGAIMAAQQAPRDLDDAQREMEYACADPGLANQAFFAVPRAGKTVNGISVHLARELARCFGNIDYGIHELNRDDTAGSSEMVAFARDVQRNTRASTTFVVPHRRAGRNAAQLVDVDDIYQNNANYGARRMREQIIAVLPRWFVARAEELCRKTIEDGDGTPLPDRIERAVASLAAIGIALPRAEAKVGAVRSRWTASDVADLGVLYQSVRQGTVTKDEAFPNATISSADLGTVPADSAAAPAGKPADTPPVEDEQPPAARPIDRTRSSHLFALLGEAGLGGRDKASREKRLRLCGMLSGRADGEPAIASTNDLTEDEADQIIATVRAWGDDAAEHIATLLADDEQAPAAADGGES